MNIRQAFNQLSTKNFVNWCFDRKYDYFIKISGNNESGWFWSKGKNPRQYKFNYNPN